MDKYEVKRLTVRRGLFNGRISEYVLAIVKNTKSILAESILVEILDNCYIANIKRYIQYDGYLYMTDIRGLPDDCRYVYGEVSSISLNGQFVRKYNSFYSSACVEKYNAVEYDSVIVGQVPDEVHRVSPMKLELLTPHIYTDILVFRSSGDCRNFSEIAIRLCNRYYLPFVANEYPKVSRKGLDENRLNIRKWKKQELFEHCVYRIYNVRVKPDRKHFFVNIYSEAHFYETETVDYELCDEVWAKELIPFQGATKEIPQYNSEGLPLGFIVGHNVCTGLSFQPSSQINHKTHRIKCDKNGYQFKDHQAWVFCLISKIDNWGNYVYVNGYDICRQRAILESNCYAPASNAIESDMLDVYIENIDLEEYRHRYKMESVLSPVQKTDFSILFVDFEIPFDKYSDALMYPFVVFPVKNAPIMPFRNQKKEYIRGNSEASFQAIMMKYIKSPYRIMDDVVLINEKDYMYEPDIAIINQKRPSVFIDIEIDEPYSASKKPIHYIGCENDTKRNEYFVKHGWIVVRFSERQIVRNPLGCLGVIEEIIASVDPSYVRNEDLLSESICKESHWTLEESSHMIETNERDEYLGRDLRQFVVHDDIGVGHKQKRTVSEKRIKEFLQEQDKKRQERNEENFVIEVKKRKAFWGEFHPLLNVGKNIVNTLKSLWNRISVGK